MLRVTMRGSGLQPVTLGSGETLLFGRLPQGYLPADDPEIGLRYSAVTLPRCAPHVSRLVGELVVGDEVVRLRWRGANEAQLSSLFEAPGGARRVTLSGGMTALLDEGENRIVVLRGREPESGEHRREREERGTSLAIASNQYSDIMLSVQVDPISSADEAEPVDLAPATPEGDDAVTGAAPTLEPRSREWYVALALAEPWLSGADDYPRPPSSREIYERVLGWHGYAWNLSRPQRVDDALRIIARLAFGPQDDPFTSPATGRAQNVRFAIGRRAAEVRLVTTDDLEKVEREARARASGR
jgi:hypothetical protein